MVLRCFQAPDSKIPITVELSSNKNYFLLRKRFTYCTVYILKSLFINELNVQCTVKLKILSLAIVRARPPRNEANPLGSTFCIDFIDFFYEKTKHK